MPGTRDGFDVPIRIRNYCAVNTIFFDGIMREHYDVFFSLRIVENYYVQNILYILFGLILTAYVSQHARYGKSEGFTKNSCRW